MKILIFTEGTILMHRNAKGCSREEIVKQIEEKDKTAYHFSTYIPIGDAVKKIYNWEKQGVEILYLTSRRKNSEIEDIRNVLNLNNFSDGRLLFREENEEYKDVAEKYKPDVLIEDDCESIGGIDEMTITHIDETIKNKIKSIPIKEFGGIDHLPDNIQDLIDY